MVNNHGDGKFPNYGGGTPSIYGHKHGGWKKNMEVML